MKMLLVTMFTVFINSCLEEGAGLSFKLQIFSNKSMVDQQGQRRG